MPAGTTGETGRGEAPLGPRQAGLVLGALLGVTAIAYAGTLFAGFVWDDAAWVLPAASRPPLEVLWTGLRSTTVGDGLAFNYYRPLVAPTFALDGWLWGMRPAGFHLTNLLLYLVCVALSYLLAKRLLASEVAALAAASVFALHPVHVEVVAWTQGRQDLLAFAAAAAALGAFPKALERTPSWPLLGGVGAAFLAAILCKEAALVAPPLALAAWAFGQEGRRAPAARAAVALAPFLLALALYVLLRGIARGGDAPPAPDLLGASERWLLAPVVFAKYVGLLFWPHPLNTYYEVQVPAGLGDPRLLAGIGLLIALLATSAWAIRRAPKVALALAWFLLGILPVLPVVPLKGFTMAERYLFIPSFGFALAAGIALECLWRRATSRPAWLAAGGCMALVALGWLAAITARVPDWVEQVAFYRAMVRTAPHSAFAHNNLGQLLLAQGNVEEGIRHLERAVVLRPDMAYAHAGLGLAYWRRGDLSRATAALRTAARFRPHDSRILEDLAGALGAHGQMVEAVGVLHRLEALRPGSPDLARRLAAAYAALGDRTRAEAYTVRAMQLSDPPARQGGASP